MRVLSYYLEATAGATYDRMRSHLPEFDQSYVFEVAEMDKNSAETSKREDEPISPNGPPATGRERREPDNSSEFLPDSPEQIEESIKRTGLRSLLDEAFRAAIERAKGGSVLQV